jgi:type IV pilus biogenesis protein CpaD/CtpE
MTTTPEPPAVRSAATVNEEIRALWLSTGGRLSTEQRDRYERLVSEWSAAMRDARAQIVRGENTDKSAEVA